MQMINLKKMKKYAIVRKCHRKVFPKPIPVIVNRSGDLPDNQIYNRR